MSLIIFTEIAVLVLVMANVHCQLVRRVTYVIHLTQNNGNKYLHGKEGLPRVGAGYPGWKEVTNGPVKPDEQQCALLMSDCEHGESSCLRPLPPCLPHHNGLSLMPWSQKNSSPLSCFCQIFLSPNQEKSLTRYLIFKLLNLYKFYHENYYRDARYSFSMS